MFSRMCRHAPAQMFGAFCAGAWPQTSTKIFLPFVGGENTKTPRLAKSTEAWLATRPSTGLSFQMTTMHLGAEQLVATGIGMAPGVDRWVPPPGGSLYICFFKPLTLSRSPRSPPGPRREVPSKTTMYTSPLRDVPREKRVTTGTQKPAVHTQHATNKQHYEPAATALVS